MNLAISFTVRMVLSFAATLVLTGCYIPGAKDYEQANAVGRFISEKYGEFEDRAVVERNYTGKIYYVRPGRHPTIYFYEVTDPNDIAIIERLAQESLVLVSINRVDLVFYEKQNMHCVKDSGCSRRWENIIKKTTISQ